MESPTAMLVLGISNFPVTCSQTRDKTTLSVVGRTGFWDVDGGGYGVLRAWQIRIVHINP